MPFNRSPTPKKFAPSIRNPTSVFERETRRVVNTFDTTSLLNGILLSNVALTTNTTRVAHKLGRPYRGWLVVDKTSTGDVWRDSSDLTAPQDAIPLKASAALTVSLWVF